MFIIEYKCSFALVRFCYDLCITQLFILFIYVYIIMYIYNMCVYILFIYVYIIAYIFYEIFRNVVTHILTSIFNIFNILFAIFVNAFMHASVSSINYYFY